MNDCHCIVCNIIEFTYKNKYNLIAQMFLIIIDFDMFRLIDQLEILILFVFIFQFFVIVLFNIFENYQKIVNDFIWNKFWLEIIQIELTTLIINKIWNVVISSKNVNIVINKWVFKIKMHVNDTLNKLKIEFVARNFSQIYEINYTNIFVSIVKFDTFRLFLVIVALKNFECH